MNVIGTFLYNFYLMFPNVCCDGGVTQWEARPTIEIEYNYNSFFCQVGAVLTMFVCVDFKDPQVLTVTCA